MITFSQLGKHGRFGNQLFQIAMTYSLAKKMGTNWGIPKWPYASIFETDFHEVGYEFPRVNELAYAYDPSFLMFFERFAGRDSDLFGYFQHTEYWTSEQEIKDLFKIKPHLVNEIRRKYSYLFERDTIMVGVRRGDYVGKLDGKYHQLSPSYYLNALQKFKYERYNIVFITDDREWCKFHFGSLPNTFFPEFTDDIEQFVIGTQGTNWIIANSTFHWWSAFLGCAERVIQPTKLFAGPLLAKEGDVNFYKKEWEFQEDEPLDLRDVTFTIPVRYDHPDRKENVDLAITLLQKAFKTNITICENGGDHFQYTEKWCDYFKFNHPDFHRTKMLNEMAKKASTPIIINYDADVAFPPAQLFQAVQLIRENKADVVYPYEYLFSRIPRQARRLIFPSYDVAVFKNMRRGVDTQGEPSHGGCIVFNKERFFEGGGENENFISYGKEDRERFQRFTKLGYRVTRTKGDLWHFDHWVGVNSTTRNPYYNAGVLEYDKVVAMTKEELRAYVDGWTWAKNYSQEYYAEISPTAIESARTVLSTLVDMALLGTTSTVLDLGAGIGQWGVAAEEIGMSYKGVDFGVPAKDWLIKDFQEHDLKEPYSDGVKYDLVTCLEVGEHIEKRYAETLVKSICRHSRDLVLFSAAFPGQGGHHHVNEQNASWWAELFAEEGFYPHVLDLRELLYDNDNVDIWYRNNAILYVKERGPYHNNYRLDFRHPKYIEQIFKHHKII